MVTCGHRSFSPSTALTFRKESSKKSSSSMEPASRRRWTHWALATGSASAKAVTLIPPMPTSSRNSSMGSGTDRADTMVTMDPGVINASRRRATCRSMGRGSISSLNSRKSNVSPSARTCDANCAGVMATEVPQGRVKNTREPVFTSVSSKSKTHSLPTC